VPNVKQDAFYAEVDELGDLTFGGGSGFNGGAWYYYPETGWWNQWFWDDPYDPERIKVVHIEFFAEPMNFTQPAYLMLAVNWSTPDWWLLDYGPDQPPEPNVPGFDEFLHIGRAVLFDQFITAPMPFVFDWTLDEYNPEWISIDIQGENFIITNGEIKHECRRPFAQSLDLAFVITTQGPTECNGDCNCDGQVDFGDINGFVDAILGGVYCDGSGANADISDDDPIHVGFEDINPFVALLTTHTLPIPCP
jgi:hypothetical protein